ncbi:MAG: flagellar export chaperone FliS [Firmicutes bacterium]|nr:flagellar export chaperone FliS [Bacillota bacterium]
MKMMPNPYAQYRQTQVQTAAPEQLIVMLYDGVIKFGLKAKECIANRDMAGANAALIRVQDIISELQLSINDEAGEIAQQLRSLYDYFYRRALDANLAKDVAIIDEIVNMVRDLRSTWVEAIMLARRQAGAADGNC